MKILKWAILGVGGFALLLTIAFAVMIFVSPPAPKKNTNSKGPTKAEIEYLRKKKIELTKIEALTLKVANLQEKLKQNEQLVDSLKQVAIEKDIVEQDLKKLSSKIKASSDRQGRAKDIAKTFTTMKAKSIAPILNKLDDDIIILIYNQTSNTSRKDLLLALTEDRAARITKKLINQN